MLKCRVVEIFDFYVIPTTTCLRSIYRDTFKITVFDTIRIRLGNNTYSVWHGYNIENPFKSYTNVFNCCNAYNNFIA